MPTWGDRWRALRRDLGKTAVQHTISQAVDWSRESLDVASRPLRRFVRAERARFEAARRRVEAELGPVDSSERTAAASVTEDDGSTGDDRP